MYEFAYAGAVGSALVPTPDDDPHVAKVEAYRKKAGAGPVTYLVAEVDNQNGSDDINMYGVTVVTQSGDQVEAFGVSDLIGEWHDAFDDTATYNDGVELYNEHQAFLRPGAAGTAILAAEGEMTGEPARVYVMPAGGFAEVEVEKVGD